MKLHFFAFALFAAAPLHASVVIQDNFDTLIEDATINGRTLSTNTVNSNNWAGPTATDAMYGDGSGGLELNTVLNRSSFLSMGTGYFAANPGVYQLSLTITHPSSYGASWIGFGFTAGANVSANLTDTTTTNAGPWMFFRASGQVNIRSSSGTAVISPYVIGVDSPVTFTLKLDTTSSTNWLLDFLVNGTPVDLNGGTAGTSANYAPRSDLSYIAISTGFSTAGGLSTADNFTLDFVPVPEPGATVLAGVAGVLFLTRRGRKYREVATS